MSETPPDPYLGQVPRYPVQPGGWQQPPEVKPGVVPLRPLGVGEILDGAVSTMRSQPRLMLGVAAVVVTITQLVSTLVLWLAFRSSGPVLEDPEPSIEDLGPVLASLLGGVGVTVVITLVAQAFLVGFVTVVVGRAVLGQRLSFDEVWQELRPRLLPLLGLTMLYTTMVAVGLVLCIVPGVVLAVMFGLATPALVFERCGIGTALGRSRTLVRGSWWRVFGVLLLALVISFLIGLIIGLPFSLAGAALDGGLAAQDAVPSLARLSLDGVGSIIAGIITYPFSAGVGALLYVDQRMRREGLDIELARAAGVALPSQHPAGPGQPPAYGQPPVYGQPPAYGQPPVHGQPPAYGQPPVHGQPSYGQPPEYGQPPASGQPPAYGQPPAAGQQSADDQLPTPPYGQPPVPGEPPPAEPPGEPPAEPPAEPGQQSEDQPPPADQPPGQAR